jgi:transposase, IS6 family
VYRWVQRFTPLLAEAARPCRHGAIDQFAQVVDVFVCPRRDVRAARRLFERAIGTTKIRPIEVVTDRAATYPVVLDELLPAAWHRTEQHANNPGLRPTMGA